MEDLKGRRLPVVPYNSYKIFNQGHIDESYLAARTVGQILEAFTDTRGPFIRCTGRDKGPGLSHNLPFSHDFSSGDLKKNKKDKKI